MYLKWKLVKIDENIVIFENIEIKVQEEYEFDYIVFFLGRVLNKEYVEEIKFNFDKVFVFGDVKEIGIIRNVMEFGFLIVYNL